VTDATSEHPPDDPPTFVALSGRDIEDARRLLTLLTEGRTCLDRGGNAPSSSPARLLGKARQILADRRKRVERFGRAMFGEPAWEILLLLYVSPGSARFTASRLAQVAGYSKATAIRWMDYLEKERLIQRRPHPTDQRSIFVELTDRGTGSLEMYLTDTLD
jgi:DNA-binding MarR family transcriptional regulator